jgi:hypothetical protein
VNHGLSCVFYDRDHTRTCHRDRGDGAHAPHVPARVYVVRVFHVFGDDVLLVRPFHPSVHAQLQNLSVIFIALIKLKPKSSPRICCVANA